VEKAVEIVGPFFVVTGIGDQIVQPISWMIACIDQP
jgi:hypothetical protein